MFGFCSYSLIILLFTTHLNFQSSFSSGIESLYHMKSLHTFLIPRLSRVKFIVEDKRHNNAERIII